MQNPYLASQGQAITDQVTNNLKTNILPSIDQGAIQAGGFGGSRQGIAQGLAIGQTNLGLGSALSNLYGQNYQADQSNLTGRMGIAANYGLGLGSQALQGQNQNMNFYTAQRGQDQSGLQLGANLYGQGNAGYVGQGSGIQTIGGIQQQAPWNVTQNAANTYSPFSGLGGSQIQTQNGSVLGSALGGALGGAQLVNNLGLGTKQPGVGKVTYGNQNNNGYGGSGSDIYGDGYGPQ